MAKLQITLDGVPVGELPVDKERITIGRRPDNDIQLDHIAVSGQHAAIVTILHDSFLEDLGSTNGTLVNGGPVRKHFLRDGDLIEIGRHRVRFIGEVVATREVADFEKTMVLNRPGATPRPAVGEDVKSVTVAPSGRALAELPVDRAVAESAATVLDSADTVVAEADAEALAVARSVDSLLARSGARAPAADPLMAEALINADETAGLPDSAAVHVSAVLPAGGSLPMSEPVGFPELEASPQPAAEPQAAQTPASTPVFDRPPPPVPGTAQPLSSVEPAGPLARLQILNGTAAGRILEINKPLTTIGRPAVQVAVISRRADGYYLAQVEGEQPARLNGADLVPHAVALREHDVLEIAGIKLEFFLHG